MRRAFALVIGLLLAACHAPGATSAQRETPPPQVQAMGDMAVNSGYVLWRNPRYEQSRWMVDVKIDSCTAIITLAGNVAPETVSATSFTVHRIDGVLFTDILPGVDTTNLPAATLKTFQATKEELGCQQGQ